MAMKDYDTESKSKFSNLSLPTKRKQALLKGFFSHNNMSMIGDAEGLELWQDETGIQGTYYKN